MTLPKLAVNLALLIGGVLAVVLFIAARVNARTQAFEAEFPPRGELLMVNGKRVQAYVMGEGPDIVLIHGASGNALDMLNALGPDLAKTNRVIAFDRPGLGYSDALDDQSLAAQVALLAAAGKQLDLRNPLIVGQSYGGAVSLDWALHAPIKPRGLVLISAASMPWPAPLDLTYRVADTRIGAALVLPTAAALLPRSYIETAVASVFAPETVPENYATNIAAPLSIRLTTLRANMAQVNALRAQLVTLQAAYPALTLPIELLHGTADTIVPATVHSIPFTKLVASAHLHLLDGAGHMPHYTRKADVLAAITRAETRAALR